MQYNGHGGHPLGCGAPPRQEKSLGNDERRQEMAPSTAADPHHPAPSCSCGVDVHAHVVPMSFPRYLKGATPADWPSTETAQACHRHVMMAGRVYRTVSDRCWDVPKRIADMEEMGLRIQAISPMPELLSYWMDLQPADDLLRYINDQIAEMLSHAEGRLVGLGAVPLQ